MMKTSLSFLTSAALLCGAASLSAQTTLYNDEFSRGTVSNTNDLPGSSPTGGTLADGTSASNDWTGTTDWQTDGSVAETTSFNAARNVFLDFTPQTGFLYTFEASLDVTTTNGQTAWVGMGFTTSSNDGAGGDTLAAQDAPGMVLFRENGGTQFLGPETNTNGPSFSAAGGAQTFKLELDTRPTDWTITASVNGNTIGPTQTYSGNPTGISHIGVGKSNAATTGISGLTDNLSLTSIPEPSAYAAAAGLVALGLAVLRWRKS